MPQTLKNRIGKIISKRILSTVFDGSVNRKKCVWKIEHVTKKDSENKESAIWKELNFSIEFGNKHPEHFMQLLYHHFNDCSKVRLMFDLDHPPALWSDQLVQEYKDVVAENICLHKAYNKMDVILGNVLPKLEQNQIYSMILQTTYALDLLHKHNYVHGDFHFGNVGAMKVPMNSFKKLGIYSVPTHGYDWKLIDFGFTVKNENADEKSEGSDLTFIQNLSTLIQSDDDRDIREAKMKSVHEYNVVKHIAKGSELKECMFMLFFPDAYQKLFHIDTVQQRNTLPPSDLIFLAHYGAGSEEAKRYLRDKLSCQ